MLEILPQLVLNSIIAGSLYALAAAGLTITYGLLRVLNFAHGHLLMVGAYAFYFAVAQQSWSLWSSAVFTVLLVSILAFLVFKIFVFPFSRINAILTLVSTLALANILEASVSMYFGVNVQSMPSSSIISSMNFLGMYITPVQILIIASALVLLIMLAFVIHCTSAGRVIRALKENPLSAETLGINRQRWSLAIFTVGTLFCAYAGILVAYETNLQPTMGSSYTIKSFATMILGGFGNVWGTMLASYLLALIENLSIGLDFGSYSIPAGYKDAFAFVIILLTLLVRPQGLFGTKERSI